MSSQKLIFLCVAERSGESEVFVLSSCSFSPSSVALSLSLSISDLFSPAAPLIVAVFDSCDHLRRREAGGGEEARGGERELVSALGAGPTAGMCVYGNVCM